MNIEQEEKNIINYVGCKDCSGFGYYAAVSGYGEYQELIQHECESCHSRLEKISELLRIVKEAKVLAEFYADKKYTVGGWHHWELPEKAKEFLANFEASEEPTKDTV